MMDGCSSDYSDNKFIIDKSRSNVFTNPFAEIRRLKKLLCYNGYYIAHLLGMTTEKEFRKISEKFIEEG